MANIENETSALRAELYAARRSVGSLQQELNKVTEDRDRLAQQLQEHQAISGELPQLQAALNAESAARQSAEEALQKVTLERQRLQRARDELATNLLAAQQRAQEAEEDQQRAEEQTAAAILELHALQARLSATGAEGSDASSAANGAEDGRELEMERSRNAVLVAALSSAKGERERAEREAASARQHILHLEQQLQATLSAGPPAPRVTGQTVIPSGPTSTAKSELSQGTSAANPEKIERQIAALKRQVLQLKASRDKLVAELDIQFVETDRLGNENAALSQALQEACEAGGAWERQTQEAAAQLERLKDLLEESALWRREQPPPQPPRPEASAPHTPGENGGPLPAESTRTVDEERAEADRQYCQAHIRDLEQRFMQECARSAALDLQVRALCAELTRAAQATGSLGKSVLPALNGIESRLSQALHVTASR